MLAELPNSIYRFVSGGIHIKTRIKSFQVEYGSVVRWPISFIIAVSGYNVVAGAFCCVTFLMCWKLLTSMILKPGTCRCPVPSGLILMSSFSPSLLSRSLKSKTKHVVSRTNNILPAYVMDLGENTAYRTLAPHCRSPQSWQWQCKTTCPSSPRSHRRDV